MKWIRKAARNGKYYIIRLVRLRNSTHQIALGLVLGFFPCWFPTFGIGPILSIALSKMLKGNLVAAVISAALGSFLWPVMFYFNYKTGSLFFDAGTAAEPNIHYEHGGYWNSVVYTFEKLGKRFMIGSILNSIVFSLIGYVIVYFIFKKYRSGFLIKLKSRAKR
ncbi:DUF2062 domain-containing protein [Marinicrinis lubricantis]|uniref:DUF2062 domain-containing protein n=1 Tax=Marinicrinis lubricantis TaxID=2086470 RepID=A0ABW1IUU9_9BACL